MTHDPNCTGCPTCCQWCATLFRANNAGDYATVTAMLTADTAKQMKAAGLRTNMEDMMAFQPRIDETTGRACCVRVLADGRRKLPEHPCPKCAKHFGRELKAASDYASPDPYEPGLAKLRAELPPNRWPEPQVAPPPKFGDYTPPDPYAADLERMKR